MVAEGAPNLPIHPRPSADPLSHLNGLLSADVRQLGHAVLVVYVAGGVGHAYRTASSRPPRRIARHPT